MCKCDICNYKFDSQFIFKFEREYKEGNVLRTEILKVCEYCDLDESEIEETEEGDQRVIEFEGKRFVYQY